jgi:hypothetical protein
MDLLLIFIFARVIYFHALLGSAGIGMAAFMMFGKVA